MAEKGTNTPNSHASAHPHGVDSSTGSLVKRRPGKLRKSDAPRNSVVPPPVTVAASLPTVTVVDSPPLMWAPPVSQVVSRTTAGFTFSTHNSANRTLGHGCRRPQASGHWQALPSIGGLFANSPTREFRVHVLDAYPREDIIGKITACIQGRIFGVCVLSANGSVDNIVLHHPGCFGRVINYEGRFEISYLNGSSIISEVGGVRRRTGGFSVSLAGPQGQVIGGGVAGPLVAASPVQMVVGLLILGGYSEAEAHGIIHSDGNTADVCWQN